MFYRCPQVPDYQLEGSFPKNKIEEEEKKNVNENDVEPAIDILSNELVVNTNKNNPGSTSSGNNESSIMISSPLQTIPKTI